MSRTVFSAGNDLAEREVFKAQPPDEVDPVGVALIRRRRRS